VHVARNGLGAKNMKLGMAILATLLLTGPLRADSGSLQVAGTATITFSSPKGGQSVENITMSYDLANGVLVPGSAQLTASGPVSFAGASLVVGGDQCGVGWMDATGSIVETDFYEDENCLMNGQVSAGDLGLFYMNCVPCGADNFGNGFAYVTDPPVNAPEPSSLLQSEMALIALIGFARARRTLRQRR
jgi:hypothetical protein